MRATVLAPLTLLLALACNPSWKAGLRPAQEGAFTAATDVWFKALDADPSDAGALKGLQTYGGDAYRQLLDIAELHEVEGHYEESLRAYEDLFAFVERLDEHDARTFQVDDDLRLARADVRQAWLDELFAAGRAASEAGNHREATETLERVLAKEPEYPEIHAVTAAAWEARGHAHVEDHLYLEALTAFDRSFELGGKASPAAWAATVRAALGRSYLKRGACRQAVEMFEAASRDVINDARLPSDQKQAEACARIELVVEPFAVARDGSEALEPVAPLMSGLLSEQIEGDASRYVVLLEPTHPRAEAPPEGSLRLRVRGELARIDLERPEPTTRSTVATGTWMKPCPDSEPGDPLCPTDVPLSYALHSQEARVEVLATLRVLDPMSGRQHLHRTLDAEHAAQREWIPAFYTEYSDGPAKVQVCKEPSERTVGIDADLYALHMDDSSLPDEEDLVDAGLRELAAEAASEILAEIDHPERVEPPKALMLKPPMLSPDDLDLDGGTPTIEREDEVTPSPSTPPSP